MKFEFDSFAEAQEAFKLFDEKGKSAGYFDVLLWIVDNYPEDIFVLENPEFLEIRDRARRLLIKHKQTPKRK